MTTHQALAPAENSSLPSLLPPTFTNWFAGRGWAPRPHQLDCLGAGLAGRSHLLIAPTGGGKTLAGFLPSLVDLYHQADAGTPHDGLHTLYISPLKALAVDIARNLEMPVSQMTLPITMGTRTGDTPSNRRQRQKTHPPHLLLTTPEQLALLLANKDAEAFFGKLRCVILDEIHAIVNQKRGHLMALGLARLRALSPGVRFTGLSATVPDPQPLLDFLTPQFVAGAQPAQLIRAKGGAIPKVSLLNSEERIPWSGHSARHAMAEMYDAIKDAKLTLIFVNTRNQAEITFQELWRINDDNLPIALHHGSLDVGRRRKVEAAMARGELRAVVCTSTLDLGIDWGDVDLVIQIGAPKGASRLTQRIGRANHRMNEPSSALLVPANRIDVLECIAAQEAIREGQLDGEFWRGGALDVLAQHIMGMACAAPFDADDLYKEVISAAPYSDLSRLQFDRVLEFVSTGGYALKNYERYRRLVLRDGKWQVRNPQVAQQYRMNVGTIVEAPALNVRLGSKKGPIRGGRKLGEVEEWFVEWLNPGDTFLFAGELLRLETVTVTDVIVSRAKGGSPKVPSWQGGKFPLSTYLADRVRTMIHTPGEWHNYPEPVQDWLRIQQEKSIIPGPDQLLIETFPYGFEKGQHALDGRPTRGSARNGRHFLVCYPFDGQLAQQTLGMLLTRRLERLGKQPIGFVPTEYALSIWARQDMSDLDMDALFDEDMLGDDLEAWLQESILMKRTFRNCAIIAGLIERRFPGQEKTGRQVTFSADLIYDVLRDHEPDHILLQAAWDDAAGGYLDLKRLSGLLARVRGKLVHKALDRVSPLAVPVMLEVNREPILGEAQDAMLAAISDDIVDIAMGTDVP
ncbi:MAG: ligase-associated DNA damage response DEXH box helicase [Pseudomonadota bacterium]